MKPHSVLILLKRQLKNICLLFLLLALSTSLYLWHWLNPYFVRAQQYDLSNIEELPVASLIYDRNGNSLGRIFEENRVILNKGQVPDIAMKAIVAAEDRRFYRHGGTDWRGVLRAAWINVRSRKIEQGASTITQQLAKHIIGDFRRTMDRKLLETFLARRLEALYSKDEILRLYLNRIYFGSGYFGLETASKGYFGKPSKDLSLAECAMVMSVVRAPSSGSPRRNPAQAELRMKRTLRIMAEEQLINRSQYQNASTEVINILPFESSGLENHFVNAVLSRVELLLELQHREQVPQGLRIYTTLDLPLQEQAEAEVERSLKEYEKNPGEPVPFEAMQAAYVAMDEANGEILVYVGSRDFKSKPFDHLRQMKRDSSGLLTPFVHALALKEWNLNPATLLDASYLKETPEGGLVNVLKDKSDRSSIIWQDSLIFNSLFSERRLTLNLGWPKIQTWLQKINWEDHPGGPLEKAQELNLLQMASLYRALSHQGNAIEPVLIRRIETARNKILFERKTATETRLFSETRAFQVLQALQDRTREGSSRLVRDYLKSPVNMAVVDSSSPGNQDSWSAGLSPRFVSLAWVGWDDQRAFPTRRAALNASLPLWSRMADQLELQSIGATEFKIAEGLTKVEIERLTGRINGFAYDQPLTGNIDLYLTSDQLASIKAAKSSAANPAQQPESFAAWFSTILASEEAEAPRPIQGPDLLGSHTIPENAEFIVPGQRGDILTSDGTILATNRKSQQLVCRWPAIQKTGSDDELVAWVEERSKAVGELFGEPLLPISRLDLIEAYTFRRFLPLILKSNLTSEEIRKFGESSLEKKGLALQGVPYRHYPFGTLLAHTLGYLSLKQAPGRGQYRASEIIHETYRGESGLEATLEDALVGKPGLLDISTNREGFLTQARMEQEPTPGANARLTVEYRWQQAVDTALAKQALPGAAVVMNIKTGDILAMTSVPTFNPNSFVARLQANEWQGLVENSQKPLLHRVFRQHYPPGSVFKIVTTVASMQAGVFDPARRITCPGYYDVGNVHYALPREVGVVAFREAMAYSYNTYFFDLGLRTGRDQMVQTAQNLGFGRRTGLSLPAEVPGLIPDPKFVLLQHQRWMGPGDVTNMSIGQGDVLATPLQMAVFMSSVANRGRMMEPRLIRQLESADKTVLQSYPVKETGKIQLSPDQWSAIHQGLRAVVTDGTAKKFQEAPVIVAAKTGTSQAGGGIKAQIAWAAGFFPYDNPEIAFVFMIEGREGLDVSSTSHAVPVALDALNIYFKKPNAPSQMAVNRTP